MNAQARRENAIELRKTHFSFGNEGSNYETQSANTYQPKDLNSSRPNIMNQGLRKTHFILGSDPVNYLSTIKEQNQAIDGHDFSKKIFNMSDMKKDLAKSHFSLGNEDTIYKSEVMTEFIDKSKIGIHKDNLNRGKELRRHNYIIGEDMPDYLSQNKMTYTKKNIENLSKAFDENKKDLQRNHYKFGYSNDPFINSARNNFAKTVEINTKNSNLQYALDSRKTNFVLGEYQPDYTSVNSNTYVTHKLDNKNMEDAKRLGKELRTHHFNWGNENHKSNLTTMNREEYKELPLNQGYGDMNSYLHENHFSIGDKTDFSNIYQTTYNNSIGVPKDLPIKGNIDNNSFKTTYLLKVDEKPDFLTEAKANFNKKEAPFSVEEISKLKQGIAKKKLSQFELGDYGYDMQTTNRENFIYNNKYKDTKTFLDEELKKDLRATHYKLGYIDKTYKSTHEETYTQLPYAKNTFDADLMNDLKRNHFDIKGEDMDEMNKKSLYMLDFSNK